jgi:seryl-tRNA synthetase
LVCRKEKELNPKRTKAEIINEALAQYVNKRLQAHGYEPVSFDVLTGN